MDLLRIEGGLKLSGEVSISGSKNAALPILISSLLTKLPCQIRNVPDLADTKFLFKLLSSLGASCEFGDNVARIDCSSLASSLAHYDVVRKMRASVLVLAPLLARLGQAKVSLPGGCAIGNRPVDIHLAGLERLGASLEVKDGYIHGTLPKGHFVGAEFEMPLPSVGATENLVMAAVLAQGKTVLYGASKEPEVQEFCGALNRAGSKIKGIGSSVLEIEGVSSLNSIDHCIRPDRIEAGTFIAIAAATKSSFRLKNIYAEDLINVLERFETAGMSFMRESQDKNILADLTIISPERLRACDIETAAHPGFPTDMQAQFMAAMTLADGESLIYERIFENRMMHVPELRRMGALIEVQNGVARVSGTSKLSGAQVMATDLRASAGLVIAALAAHGVSEIRRVYHLDRGYEALEKKLLKLGARVARYAQNGT